MERFTITFFAWEAVIQAESVTKEGDTTTVRGLAIGAILTTQVGELKSVLKYRITSGETPQPKLMGSPLGNATAAALGLPNVRLEGVDESGHREVIVFE